MCNFKGMDCCISFFFLEIFTVELFIGFKLLKFRKYMF